MAARAASRRLAGVSVESRAPRLADTLPRMDVAAFVGFAASGPIDTPVPVEDPATFADLFGDDAVLAWDRERCEIVRSSLGPAVRSFFRNGGRRGWIVRVAGDEAQVNRFPVPGLLRLEGGGLRPAVVQARSAGSWSDRLGVAAALQPSPATIVEVVFDGDDVAAVRLGAPDTITVGDLLRLTWPGGDALAAAVVSIDGDVATLDEATARWFSSNVPGPMGVPTATWFPGGGPAPLAALDGDPAWNTDGTVTVRLLGDAPVEPGNLVRLDGSGQEIWLLVDDKRAVERTSSPPGLDTEISGRFSRVSATAPAGVAGGAVPVGERLRLELAVRADGGHPIRLGDLGLAPGHPRYLGALPSDERLFQLGDDLPSLYEQALRDVVRDRIGDAVTLDAYHADLWRAVATPRFPLATEGLPEVFFPIGLLVVPAAYLGANAAGADAATRDGLAAFTAAPFLDPELADETAESLPAQADFVRWQAPSPRRLRGLHALFGVEEVTLIALPDVTQRGWSAEVVEPPSPLATPVIAVTVLDPAGSFRLAWNGVDPDAAYALERATSEDFANPEVLLLGVRTLTFEQVVPAGERRYCRVRAYLGQDSSFWSDPVLLVAPVPQFADCPDFVPGVPALALAEGPDANGSYRLAWTAVPGALRYLVQESSELDFTGATVVYAGDATDVTLYGRAPGRYHYRVRAEGHAAHASDPVPQGDTLLLEITGVDTPRHLVLDSFPGGIGEETVFDGTAFTERFVAASSRDAIAGGFRYRLVRDDAWPGPPSFRAFVLDVTGAFSPGVTVAVAAPPRLVLLPERAYAVSKPVLLTVQAALARMCAARGDLLAVLALPEHYRENDAVAHTTELRALLPEETSWSHAALYHPWLVVDRGVDAELVRVPPDGATMGVMAARAVDRGAWIAPANQPLGDVLGLSREIDRAQWQRLLEAQVNLVRQEPRGFLALAADTLAADPDLVPINVRRLLALLRRAALRLGPTFVFEPNNLDFEDAVAREFDTLLAGLFRAGAFAGATAATSFQVVVDASDNPPDSRDQGRFVVELKVAPSLPLSFITVRLVQNDDRSQVTEAP